MYYYQTNSNAAPFISDVYSDFIEAPTAMLALKQVVAEYKHPCGLYAAVIQSESKQKTLARFISMYAIATEKARKMSEGGLHRKGDMFRIFKKGGHHWIPLKDLATEDKWEDLE